MTDDYKKITLLSFRAQREITQESV